MLVYMGVAVVDIQDMIEPPERQWIDPKAFLEASTFGDIPLEMDNIDFTILRNQQRLEYKADLTKPLNRKKIKS
jgi:hypothetical protein